MKTTKIKILYDGLKEELYAHFYECIKYDGGDILKEFKYCPHCGKKISGVEE